MFIGTNRKMIVDSFLSRPRIQMIHNALNESLHRYCNQQGHQQIVLDIYPDCEDGNGTTNYGTDTFTVCFKHDCEEAEFVLAHELLHCKLVLDGATLAIRLQSEPSPITQFVWNLLRRSITHHALIVTFQELYGYSFELRKFALPLSLLSCEPDPTLIEQHGLDERAFLLCLIGKRLFIYDENADNLLRSRVRKKGLEKLYDRICGEFPDGVDPINYVNALSQEVILTMGMEKEIKLVNLADS